MERLIQMVSEMQSRLIILTRRVEELIAKIDILGGDSNE